jgi:sirohydrochlorin ferrochelatase
MSSALLLIAHGSRRPSANADLVILADALRGKCIADIVEVAYLELAEPSIPDGGAKCVAAGADHVRMFPYFLSAGQHVAADLEEFREQLATTHPGTRFELCPHLGLHPLMVDIVLDRLHGSRASLGDARPAAE